VCCSNLPLCNPRHSLLFSPALHLHLQADVVGEAMSVTLQPSKQQGTFSGAAINSALQAKDRPYQGDISRCELTAT
jgi:hypothetical protein